MQRRRRRESSRPTLCVRMSRDAGDSGPELVRLLVHNAAKALIYAGHLPVDLVFLLSYVRLSDLEHLRSTAPVKSRFFQNRAGDCRFLDLDSRVPVDKNH
jgi:hypothetical protein